MFDEWPQTVSVQLLSIEINVVSQWGKQDVFLVFSIIENTRNTSVTFILNYEWTWNLAMAWQCQNF